MAQESRQAQAQPQAPARYNVGLKDDCPFDVLSVGGVTFQKRSEDVSDKRDASGATVRTERRGTFVSLSADDIARVRAAAERKVIRAAAPRPLKYDVDDRRYERHPSDTPVSKWIYLHPAPQEAQPAAS
jgi:hypothetical protein